MRPRTPVTVPFPNGSEYVTFRLFFSFLFPGFFFLCPSSFLSLTSQKSDQHPDPVGWCENEAIRARFGDRKKKTSDRDGQVERKSIYPSAVPSDLNLEKDPGWKKHRGSDTGMFCSG